MLLKGKLYIIILESCVNMYEFLFLFLMFMIYSIIGWIMETVGMSVYNKHFTLRGFLIGPYCPVYGIGAVTMILFL